MTAEATAAPLAPARPVRAERARRLLLRIVAGVLTLQLVAMLAAGPLALLRGEVPHALTLAALLAPIGKLLSLGALAVVTWTAARSVVAVQMWVLGQGVAVLGQLVAPQADATVLDGLLSLVVFTGVVIALRPHRRELLRLQLSPDARLALAALPIVAAGVVLAINAHHAPAVAGLPAAELAEVRFDLAVLGLALVVLAAWAAARPSRRTWPALAVAAAAMLAGVLVLAFPSAWASPGPVAGGLLVVGGVAMAVRARQIGRPTNAAS